MAALGGLINMGETLIRVLNVGAASFGALGVAQIVMGALHLADEGCDPLKVDFGIAHYLVLEGSLCLVMVCGILYTTHGKDDGPMSCCAGLSTTCAALVQ